MQGTDEGSRSLTAIARALRRAAPVVAADPSQLAGQVLGRLGEETGGSARALCRSVARDDPRGWLRPLTASLRGRGGADVLSVEGGAGSGLAFVQHLGRRLLAHGDIYRGFALWDVDRGERVVEFPPPHELPEVRHAACGQVGDRVVVVTDDEDRCVIRAWVPESAAPFWEASPWTDETLEDPLVQLRTLALGGDPTDPLVAVSVWHREDRTDRVWLLDPLTGKVRRTIEGEGGDRIALGARAGRTLVATAVREGEGVWDCGSGRLEGTFPSGGRTWGRPPVAVGAMGGRWCVATPVQVGDEDGVAVWDGASGERLAFAPLGRGVAGMAFPDDDRGLLAVGCADWISKMGEVHVWDVRAGTVLATVPIATERAAEVALRMTPSPALLAVATGDTIRVLDLDRLLAGDAAEPAHRAEVTAVAFGAGIASGDRDGVVRLWSWDGVPSERHEIAAAILGLAWCALDGTAALAVATEHEIAIVDPASGRSLRRFPVEGTVQGALAAVEAEDGWRLAVETSRLVMPDAIDPWDPDAGLGQPVNVHQVQVLDLARGSKAYELGHRTAPLARRVDGRAAFVVLGRHGEAELVDAREGSPLGGHADDPAGTAGRPGAVAHALGKGGRELEQAGGDLAAPLGRRAGRVVAVVSGREVRLWDLEDEGPFAAFTADETIACLAVGDDGRRLVVGDRSGAVHHLEVVGRAGLEPASCGL